MHLPKSIIILFVGMAAIAVAANFLKGVETAGATQIAPSMVMSRAEQIPAATLSSATPTMATQGQAQASSLVQTLSPSPAPTTLPSITTHRARDPREDD